METTQIYLHVARKGPSGVASPLDALADLSPEGIEAAVRASRSLPMAQREEVTGSEGDDEEDEGF